MYFTTTSFGHIISSSDLQIVPETAPILTSDKWMKAGSGLLCPEHVIIKYVLGHEQINAVVHRCTGMSFLQTVI
jgi:hypothetical protein